MTAITPTAAVTRRFVSRGRCSTGPGSCSCCSPSLRSCSQKKRTGVTISTCSSDDTMPPSTGVASGFITSAPTRVLHMIGSRPAITVDTVITFRAQPEQRALDHRLAQGGARQRTAHRFALPRDRLLEVNHHDDAGLDRRAEQRDEPDPHGDRKVVAKQPEEIHAAGERKGNGEEDVCRFGDRVIGEVEEHEDHEEHDRQDDLQTLPCVFLILPAPTPAHVIAPAGSDTSRATVCRASLTKLPTSRPCTFISTVAMSSPFSDEIIAGPRACSMRASWLNGICAPFGAATSTCPSACGSARYCGAYRTRTGKRRRPSMVVVRTSRRRRSR